MTRKDVTELHYISPIQNISSILKLGLLSHNRAHKVPHSTVAMPGVQERRKDIKVPLGLHLHDYVNLYFHARNPMLYVLKAQHQDLCVLRISSRVLDLQDVVITDGNAASRYTRFLPAPSGLSDLNSEDMFAQWWTDEDIIREWEKKRKRCAEVLVPHRIEVEYIIGAYVSCEVSAEALRLQGFEKPIAVDAHLFFAR